MTSTSGIKIDEKTKARLQALGKRRDRSPHWLMKHAIEEYLEREEAYEREKEEDEERWQKYMRTGVAIPHEEVEAWMDKEIAALSAKFDKRS